MPVSNEKFYKPEEALHELQVQETILKTAIDVQVALRILVDKEIVTREEVQKYREEVSNSPKYKIVLDDISMVMNTMQMIVVEELMVTR